MKKKMIVICSAMLFFSSGLWANESNSNASDVDTSEVIYADAESPEVSQPSEDSVGVEVAESPEASQPSANRIGVEVDFPGSDVSGNSTSQSSVETLSVDFPDEEIRTILRNIADLFELNLVIPDTLQGRSSLKLRDVTWQQIFTVVLSPVGFTYVEEANIIKVVTAESLVAEPPVTEIFMLNYARANEIAPTIISMVDATKGGRVQVDSRSNALVITERPSQMGRIRPIIDSLDRATEQVMIETKFVEVTDRDIKNIGVNWASLNGYEVSAGPFKRDYNKDAGGGRTNESEALINQGNNSFTTGSGSGVDGDIGDYTATLTDNLTNTTLLDAASSTTQSVNRSLGSLLGAVDQSRLSTAVFNAAEFKFVLSALKSQNETRLISNPTVVTLNNKEAVISIGEQFPVPNYTYNQERGTFEVSGFEYKDIGIIMKVTPQVNNDGLITLKVDPEVSSRSGTTTFGGAGGAEIPIISTRRTSTQVALKDGYTMGLGGLIESTIGNGSTKVPVLGDIPILGRLFRSNSKDTTKRNLLVFITARTLSPDGGTYQDVFDPRAIREMNLRREDIPGYRSNIDPFAVETASIDGE